MLSPTTRAVSGGRQERRRGEAIDEEAARYSGQRIDIDSDPDPEQSSPAWHSALMERLLHEFESHPPASAGIREGQAHADCLRYASISSIRRASMAQLQVRNLPDEVYNALLVRAERAHRSLNQQAIAELQQMPESQSRQRRLLLLQQIKSEIGSVAALEPAAVQLLREDRAR
jgi:plasmid stability protein